MRPIELTILGSLFVARLSFGGEADVARVFQTPPAPDDLRLRVAYDVDHPAPFEPHFNSVAEWEARATELRRQMRVALGLWPMPPRTPLDPHIHGKIDRDEYTVEKVFFQSLPGHYVSGNLYRPKNRPGPLPAVLCPHGHWEHGRFTVNNDSAIAKQMSEGAEATRESAYAPQQARCAMLARMGCVVFHYDMIGYADSTSIAHRTGFNDAQAELRLQSFMGLQTWNSIRCLDFLIGLPEVDARRIAVTGESGGGTQTMILCAIDDRPAVSVPVVMVSAHMQGGCICENCSLLRVGANNIEFASLVAPRPQAMIAANDWTRDLETNGLPQIRSIYALYNAADKVTGKHLSFEHNYNQVSREFMYAWVNRWLKLGYPEPVKERPFLPLAPSELSVYDQTHPRPADSADAARIRDYMAHASDAQLQAIGKDPEAYRRTIEGALHAMLQDHLPLAESIESNLVSSQVVDGVRIDKGAFARHNSGEQVPFIRLTSTRVQTAGCVLWIDPRGKQCLFEEGGKLLADARRLLDAGNSIVAIDAFATGELVKGLEPMTNPAGRYENLSYAGYTFGYNRGLLGNRIHDVITAIALAAPRDHKGKLKLIGTGRAGLWALLALAATQKDSNGAPFPWQTAAIDLDGFDFSQVKDCSDPMMLPGALKYGGIEGLLPLCTAGQTLCWNAPPATDDSWAPRPASVKLMSSKPTLREMVDALIH